MTQWYIFPVTDAHCIATHDTTGWVVTATPATHPSNGAPCQVFDIPTGTPDGHGCALQIFTTAGKLQYDLHGVLYLALPTGAGLVVDVYPKPPVQTVVLPRLMVNGQFLETA